MSTRVSLGVFGSLTHEVLILPTFKTNVHSTFIKGKKADYKIAM